MDLKGRPVFRIDPSTRSNRGRDASLHIEEGEMMSKKRVLCAAAVMTVAISGCHILGGGGWLPGLYGGKAHFGFEAHCVQVDDLSLFYEGDFQYSDRSAGVRFHGAFELNAGIGGGTSCEQVVVDVFPDELSIAELSGTCWSQPDKHQGTFTVYVEDNGTPGMAGDYIEITAIGCGPDGGDYAHAGTLGGGNIWFEDHDD
jgi:hypothetical protein